MLHADLRRPEDVARGMKRNADAIHVHRFAPVHGANGLVLAESRPQNRLAFVGAQVTRRPPSGVVTMTMRDDSTLDRLPRVDVEVSSLAIEAALGQTEQRHPV